MAIKKCRRVKLKEIRKGSVIVYNNGKEVLKLKVTSYDKRLGEINAEHKASGTKDVLLLDLDFKSGHIFKCSGKIIERW